MDDFRRFEERGPFGDLEYSIDGSVMFVETLPSNISSWRATARKLELKFKIPVVKANYIAFMIHYIGDGSPDVVKWGIELIKEVGVENAYDYLLSLFKELKLLEPQVDRPHFPESLEEAYWEAVKEESEKAPCFRALPVLPEELPPTKWEKKEAEKASLIYNVKTKVRRLGNHQLSAAGRKLFEWSKRPEIRKYLGFEEIQGIWEVYKARKQYLAENFPKTPGRKPRPLYRVKRALLS